MRKISTKKENIQKALELHCEYVIKMIKKWREDNQQNLYYRISTLLNGSGIPLDEEYGEYAWVKKFIRADVETLRFVVERKFTAIKCPEFKEMYDSFARQSQGEYTPAKMTELLEIKVCPYCDRNYIDNVRRKDGKIRRGNHLDHFFPKGEYPMLAMCFFNLIPVCATCNSHKHNYELSMNPYEEEIEEHTFFDIAFKNDGRLSEDNMEVNLLYTQDIKDNVEILALDQVYKGHADIAYEIVVKSIYYNEAKKYELCRNYPQLFRSIEEVDRILYGMDFKNMNRRPLQKFYKDILRVYYSNVEDYI